MSKLILRKYQKEGVLKIREFGGTALLADEMGLGKTIQALKWCARMPNTRPLVIVCPAAVKWSWKQECLTHFGSPSYVCEGRKPPKRDRELMLHSIYIINYDILTGWLPVLKRIKPKILVMDEVHFLKNRKSDRFKNVRKLCRSTRYRIALSGTPITNRPSELWSILNLLRPDLYKSFFKFGFDYCKPHKTPWGWRFDGAYNVDKLHAELQEGVMIRRLKSDVLKDLPEKTRCVIPIKLNSYSEYNRASGDFLAWLNSTNPCKLKSAKKAQALVKLGVLIRMVADLKKPFVFDWIDNFLEETDRKLVVMMVHKKIMRCMVERYGKTCVYVHGGVSNKKKEIAIRAFQTNPKKRLFFGNVISAGAGITLTAASDLLFIELSPVPAVMAQAEDRIHRIGQTSRVNIHYMVAEKTVEQKLSRILLKKQHVLNQTLNGVQVDCGDNIFEQLLNYEK